MAEAILATLAGASIFAAFKLGTTGRLKFSSTAAAGAVRFAWMIYVSIVPYLRDCPEMLCIS